MAPIGIKTNRSISTGDEYTVDLKKNEEGSLGVSLIGQRDSSGTSGIYVVSITPGGSADKDGRIQIGDQVLTINDVELDNKSQKETFALIKDSPKSAKITLIRSGNELNLFRRIRRKKLLQIF